MKEPRTPSYTIFNNAMASLSVTPMAYEGKVFISVREIDPNNLNMFFGTFIEDHW